MKKKKEEGKKEEKNKKKDINECKRKKNILNERNWDDLDEKKENKMANF